MGNLDSKLSIAHFSWRRKCPDVCLGLTLTWRTVPGVGGQDSDPRVPTGGTECGSHARMSVPKSHVHMHMGTDSQVFRELGRLTRRAPD